MLFHKLLQNCLLLCAMLIVVSCDNAETKYQKYMDRGNSYYEAGDFVRARLEYRNAAKIMPDSAQVLYKFGLVEEAEGHLEKAGATFIMAEQQAPEFIPVLEKLATLFFWAHHMDESQKRVDTLLKLDPDNAKGHAINGALLLKKDDLEAARKEAEHALKIDETNPIAFSVLSGVFLAEDNIDEALISLERGISFNKDDLSLLLLKAAIYNKQGNMEEVAKVYRDIMAIKPEYVDFGYDLAAILIKSGQMEKAEAVYRKMVEDFPDNLDAKYKLALFVEKKNGAEAAKEIVKTFIEQDAEQGLFPLWLSDIYVRYNEEDRAIETLNALIRTNPEEKILLKARRTLASILFGQGDIEGAEKLVKSLLEKDINDNEALFLRAGIALSRKDFRQAIADLRTIPDESVVAQKAEKLLAEAHLLQGESNLAIETLDQAMKKNPEDVSIRIRLSQLYYQTGNRKQAQKTLEDTIESFPKIEAPYLLLAKLMLEEGENVKAAEILEQAGKAAPSALKASVMQAQIMIDVKEIDKAIAIYEDVLKRDNTIDLVANNLAQLLMDFKADDATAIERASVLVQRFVDSENPHYLDTLGWVYFRSGELEKAETVLLKAMALQTEPSAQIRAHYGTVLMALGREEEAKKYLD